MIWMLLLMFTAVVLTLTVFMPIRFTARFHNQILKSQIFKIIPTILAMTCALWACCKNGWTDTYSFWIFVGLAICIAADFLLDYVFLLGGTLFFFAHVSFVLGMSRYLQPGLWPISIGVGCWICGSFFIFRFLKKMTRLSWYLKVGILLYSFALCALLGFAIPLPFKEFSPRSVMALTGAVLFVASDVMLAKNAALKRGHQYQFAALTIYYMALFVLAMSTWPVF